jgi:hypothetical protein
MVPRNYWTTQRILQQKSCLLKQPKPRDHNEAQNNTDLNPNEAFVSEALVAVNCKNADLDIISQNCKDLNKEQMAKLLTVWKSHESPSRAITAIGNDNQSQSKSSRAQNQFGPNHTQFL